jgi:ribA/ribD-fused uncharacterized protein
VVDALNDARVAAAQRAQRAEQQTAEARRSEQQMQQHLALAARQAEAARWQAARAEQSRMQILHGTRHALNTIAQLERATHAGRQFLHAASRAADAMLQTAPARSLSYGAAADVQSAHAQYQKTASQLSIARPALLDAYAFTHAADDQYQLSVATHQGRIGTHQVRGVLTAFDAEATARRDCVLHSLLAHRPASAAPARGALLICAEERKRWHVAAALRMNERLPLSSITKLLEVMGRGIARLSFIRGAEPQLHTLDPSGSRRYALVLECDHTHWEPIVHGGTCVLRTLAEVGDAVRALAGRHVEPLLLDAAACRLSVGGDELSGNVVRIVGGHTAFTSAADMVALLASGAVAREATARVRSADSWERTTAAAALAAHFANDDRQFYDASDQMKMQPLSDFVAAYAAGTVPLDLALVDHQLEDTTLAQLLASAPNKRPRVSRWGPRHTPTVSATASDAMSAVTSNTTTSPATTAATAAAISAASPAAAALPCTTTASAALASTASAAPTAATTAATTASAATTVYSSAATSAPDTVAATTATAATVELRRLPYTIVPKAVADATALRANTLVHGGALGMSDPLFDPSAGTASFALRTDIYGAFSLWKDGYAVTALPGSATNPSAAQHYNIAEQHFKASIVVEHAGDYARADEIRKMPVTELADRKAVKASTRPEHFTFPEGELQRFENGVDLAIMISVQRTKFTTHANLRAMLLATGNKRIVEAAMWDANWGAGRDGKGRNKLGACLMALRAELRAADAHTSA